MLAAKSLLYVSAFCLLSCTPCAMGQQVSSVMPVPNCSIAFSLAAEGAASPVFDNRQKACAYWIVGYTNTGFEALTLTLQSADDAGGVPSTFGTYQGTVSLGANPASATTSAYAQITPTTAYNPWVKVTLSGVTGTGKVSGVAFGWQNNPMGGGGGGGGGGVVTSACTNFATISTSATTNELIAATTGKAIKVCDLQLTPASTVTVDLVSGTTSSTPCDTGPTTLVSYQSITALDVFTALAPLPLTTSQALCMTLSSGVTTTGIVLYALQ